MKIVYDIENMTIPLNKSALTIGKFDGIHRGHQHIIENLVKTAQYDNVPSVLFTFDPPPSRVLGLNDVPRILSLSDKIAYSKQHGIDIFICQTFSKEFAEMDAESFSDNIIQKWIRPKHIFVGYDFYFGKNKSGNADFLRNHFKDLNCTVHQFNPLAIAIPNELELLVVSSTAIRSNILSGNVLTAAYLLGKPHQIHGNIVHGDAIGRTIGFPTANIKTDHELIPCDGVYATYITIKIGNTIKKFESITNIGIRPTVGGKQRKIEVHIFDFNNDIYGSDIVLEFITHIRKEIKFSGLDELKNQIKKDISVADNCFKKIDPYKQMDLKELK